MNDINEKQVKAFLQRIEKFKHAGGVDLSAAEDLSIAVMNLIALEEHFFFTGAKTKDGAYFDLVSEIRDMRKRLMARLDMGHQGETWCATKHLLSGSMRLIEVGSRMQGVGEKEKAREAFEDAYRLYAIFWSLKAKLLDVHTLAAKGKEADEHSWSLEQLVERLADCCKE